jgi:hypothetical protein
LGGGQGKNPPKKLRLGEKKLGRGEEKIKLQKKLEIRGKKTRKGVRKK